MASRPVLRCSREVQGQLKHILSLNRALSTSALNRNDSGSLQTENPPPPPPPPYPLMNADTVHTRKQEKRLFRKQGLSPIGSRRRRTVLYEGSKVPFEQEPYQCFQEARKVLAADREEKLAQIEIMKHRLKKREATPGDMQGGEYSKQMRLHGLRKHLEDLKILADINDPVIKKRFEDGLGDLNKPIYRYLANRKWRKYPRLILMQRIDQYRIVPELLSHLDPTAAVSLSFGRRKVQIGQFIDSRVSERIPRLGIQLFDKGERLVTIAAMDPDVPDLENDSFASRCHFLAINVPVSPTSPSVALAGLSREKQVIQPWLPPFAQKGSPYHRLALFVLEQKDNKTLDVEQCRRFQAKRENWTVKRMMSNHQLLNPIGLGLFRTQWDQGTDGVMQKAGMEGADLQLLRKKSEKNVYKKKDGSRYR